MRQKELRSWSENLTPALAGALSKALNEKVQIVNPQAGLYQQTGFRDVTYPNEFRQRKDYVGVFFAALNVRANMIAHFMQELYVERKIGQHEYEEVEFTHPWVELLSDVSPYYDDATLWKWMSLNIDLTGRADFINEFDDRGRLTGMIPLFKEFGVAEAIPGINGQIRGWSLYKSSGEILPVQREAITRIGNVNPLNPFQNYSLIEAARFDLEEDAEMRESRVRSSRDGGFRADMLTTTQDLDSTQVQDVTAAYKKFLGKKGEGKLAVLPSGLQPQKLINSRDLQYIEGKNQTKENILFITGVPKGVFESATTRATAEAARYQLIDGTIAPGVRSYASQLTKQLEVIFNSNPGVLKIRPPEMIPLDPDFSLREMEVKLRTGVWMINEQRRKDGNDEVEGGDVPLVAMSQRPLNEIVRQPEAQLEPTRTAQTRDNIRTIKWRAVDQKKKRQASMMSPVLQQWYDEIQSEIARTIRDKQTRTVDEIFTVPFDSVQALERLYELVTPEVARTLREGFQNVMSEAGLTGLDFSLEYPSSRRALEAILRNQAGVADTLLERTGNLIRDGIKQGKSNRELLSDVGQYFGDIEGSKQTIVNSIATAAWESGQQVAYNEAGITHESWLSSRDERVRDTHFDADGQRIPINETFTVGGSSLRYPADPDGPTGETIGCRCSTLPELDDTERATLQNKINMRKLRKN